MPQEVRFLGAERFVVCGPVRQLVTLEMAEILGWLREADSQQLEVLWQRADSTRREHVGDAVHLRGLLEISNYCDRACLYCGLRMPNSHVVRYRLTADEIVAGAHEAVARGYGSVVMQAGEDPGLGIERLCRVIRQIKDETPLAITLSLGERSDQELVALRQAGADRYLLRFETSNIELFQQIHPLKVGEVSGQRRAMLERLRDIGFELGSGVMIGLPGQTVADLARDIDCFQQLDLDMIGVGPFIRHPDTPLGTASQPAAAEYAQSDELTTYKMIALARLACPRTNIPSTTALATINPQQGQSLGLQRGANVVMPNLTPLKYRRDYAIYPHKAGSQRTPAESDIVVQEQLTALGRPIASGRGDSPNVVRRREAASVTGTDGKEFSR